MMANKNFYQRGSSLIEIIIATGVMAIVLTAIVAGLTISLKTNSESEYRFQAVKKAQEAMETFRRERTLLGWQSFLTSMQANATYCLATLPEPRESFTVGACGAEDTIVISGIDFYREASVTVDTSNPNDEQIKVVITMTWYVDDDVRTAEIAQNFRDWR